MKERTVLWESDRLHLAVDTLESRRVFHTEFLHINIKTQSEKNEPFFFSINQIYANETRHPEEEGRVN